MKYRLNITVLADNPDYAEQLKEYRENERYRSWNGQDRAFPSAQTTVQVLDTVVTEEAFAAIRKACLEVI